MTASITVHLQIFKRPQLLRFSTDLDKTGINIHGLFRSFIQNTAIIRVTAPFKPIYIETIQPPETNETLFRLGVEFVGAELLVLLLEAEFARGRVCKGSSLAGPTIAQLEGSLSSESTSDYL